MIVKTAISLNDFIYKEMDALARRLHIPRSKLFALAAEEFLQRHRKEDLIRKINEAVDDKLSREDKQWLSSAKRKQKQIAGDKW